MFIGHQSGVVHLDRDKFGSDAAKGVSGTAITGVFHPHFVTAIQQQGGNQLQGLLRTGQHHDLLRIAVNAARLADIAGNGFA